MSKLKPQWVKTTIPRAIKIKLWRMMEGNITYSTWLSNVESEKNKVLAWQMDRKKGEVRTNDSVFEEMEVQFFCHAEDRELYLTGASVDLSSPSRDTYTLLQQEIREMPLTEVIRLPQDLQDWIIQLRPELEDEIACLIKSRDSLAERHDVEEHAGREPTWAIQFASELRNTLQLQKPAYFFPTDLASGDHCIESGEGLEGYFYWNTDVDGDVEIRLYNNQTTSFLENSDWFRRFLDVRPNIGPLLNIYKESAAEYVVAANNLIIEIMKDGKRQVADLCGSVANNANQTQSFIDASPSSPRLPPLLYPKEVEGQMDVEMVVLTNEFFTTAYSEVIANVGEYETRPKGTYQIVPMEHNSAALEFNHRYLAEGGLQVINSLIKIHKGIVRRFSTRRSDLAQAVLASYSKADETKEELIMDL